MNVNKLFFIVIAMALGCSMGYIISYKSAEEIEMPELLISITGNYCIDKITNLCYSDTEKYSKCMWFAESVCK